jgi:hypothetical protein
MGCRLTVTFALVLVSLSFLVVMIAVSMSYLYFSNGSINDFATSIGTGELKAGTLNVRQQLVNVERRCNQTSTLMQLSDLPASNMDFLRFVNSTFLKQFIAAVTQPVPEGLGFTAAATFDNFSTVASVEVYFDELYGDRHDYIVGYYGEDGVKPFSQRFSRFVLREVALSSQQIQVEFVHNPYPDQPGSDPSYWQGVSVGTSWFRSDVWSSSDGNSYYYLTFGTRAPAPSNQNYSRARFLGIGYISTSSLLPSLPSCSNAKGILLLVDDKRVLSTTSDRLNKLFAKQVFNGTDPLRVETPLLYNQSLAINHPDPVVRALFRLTGERLYPSPPTRTPDQVNSPYTSRQFVDVDGRRYLVLAETVPLLGYSIGLVWYCPMDELLQDLQYTQIIVAFTTLAAGLLLALLVGLFSFVAIGRPLHELHLAMSSLARLDLKEVRAMHEPKLGKGSCLAEVHSLNTSFFSLMQTVEDCLPYLDLPVASDEEEGAPNNVLSPNHARRGSASLAISESLSNSVKVDESWDSNDSHAHPPPPPPGASAMKAVGPPGSGPPSGNSSDHDGAGSSELNSPKSPAAKKAILRRVSSRFQEAANVMHSVVIGRDLAQYEVTVATFALSHKLRFGSVEVNTWRQTVSDFQYVVTEAVNEFKGRVFDQRASSLSAVWYRVPHGEKKACEAALKVLNLSQAIRVAVPAFPDDSIPIGVGITTGKALVGATGTSLKRGFICEGSVVPLCQCVALLSLELRVPILTSKRVWNEVQFFANFRPIDVLKAPASHETICHEREETFVELHQCMGLRSDVADEWMYVLQKQDRGDADKKQIFVDMFTALVNGRLDEYRQLLASVLKNASAPLGSGAGEDSYAESTRNGKRKDLYLCHRAKQFQVEPTALTSPIVTDVEGSQSSANDSIMSTPHVGSLHHYQEYFASVAAGQRRYGIPATFVQVFDVMSDSAAEFVDE